MKAKLLALQNEQNMFWTLVVAVVALCVVYIYFVKQTVLNIVARSNMEQQMAILHSKIADQEFKYTTLKNHIDINLAYSLGYKEVADAKFIGNVVATRELSFNAVRR